MLSPDYNQQQPRSRLGTVAGSSELLHSAAAIGGGGGSLSSSIPSTTSDRLTPDSDSDDDYNVTAPATGEAYELQEREGTDYFGGEYKRQEEEERRIGSGTSAYAHDDGYTDEYYEEEDGDDDDGGKGSHPQSRRGPGMRRGRGGSPSTVASFQLYTPDEEKAVVRKFDRKLVVFVALLYMLAFLDRSNIGNARIAGMDDDLQSVPPRKHSYEWALSAFYIAYIAFEWMSLLWRLIPAHIYVSVLVLSWGLTASMQAVAVNYPMLIFLRALLGIGEAGFTGIPFYLSFFFKRNELAFRTAIFISAAPLATSFASSLAWLIIKLGEYGPVAPWRLLFLIEGFPSVLVALVAWNIIPDSPETAPYLTKREKKVARLRLSQEKSRKTTTTKLSNSKTSSSLSSRLNARDVLSVFCDPVAWLASAIFFLTNMAYSSLPVFLPTILTAMGHSALSAQALAAPPYLVSFLVVLATAHLSDRTRSRTLPLIVHALASSAGYAVLALSGTRFLRLEPGSLIRYLAVYPAAIGFFNVVVLTIAWSINNQRGESRQGGGFAMLQLVGQCGPLVGTRLYPDAEAPYYTRGMAVCAAAMAGVAVLAGVLRWYLGRLNRRLDEADGGGGDGEEGRGGDEEAEGLVWGTGGRRRRRTGGVGGGGGFRYML